MTLGVKRLDSRWGIWSQERGILAADSASGDSDEYLGSRKILNPDSEGKSRAQILSQDFRNVNLGLRFVV